MCVQSVQCLSPSCPPLSAFFQFFFSNSLLTSQCVLCGRCVSSSLVLEPVNALPHESNDHAAPSWPLPKVSFFIFLSFQLLFLITSLGHSIYSYDISWPISCPALKSSPSLKSKDLSGRVCKNNAFKLFWRNCWIEGNSEIELVFYLGLIA